jgi:hypothetical protein
MNENKQTSWQDRLKEISDWYCVTVSDDTVGDSYAGLINKVELLISQLLKEQRRNIITFVASEYRDCVEKDYEIGLGNIIKWIETSSEPTLEGNKCED